MELFEFKDKLDKDWVFFKAPNCILSKIKSVAPDILI